jgi:hypothetical protein
MEHRKEEAEAAAEEVVERVQEKAKEKLQDLNDFQNVLKSYGRSFRDPLLLILRILCAYQLLVSSYEILSNISASTLYFQQHNVPLPGKKNFAP